MTHFTALQLFALVFSVDCLLIVLTFGVMLFINYERGMAMLAGLALFIKSIFKSARKPERPRHHRRSSDSTEHEHRRRTPSHELGQTIRDFAPPPPTRKHPTDE